MSDNKEPEKNLEETKDLIINLQTTVENLGNKLHQRDIILQQMAKKIEELGIQLIVLGRNALGLLAQENQPVPVSQS